MTGRKSEASGPSGYINWIGQKEDDDEQGIFEVNLYSDAHFTSQIESGTECPYAILNALPMPLGYHSGIKHALTLRIHVFREQLRLHEEKTDSSNFHGGWLADEIAALISLLTGTRMQPGSITRDYSIRDDPMGSPMAENEPPAAFTQNNRFLLGVPGAKGEHNITDLMLPLFYTYPSLSSEQAIRLTRAARLYQDALWICESQPEMAWLLLTSAIEVLAVFEQLTCTSPQEILEGSYSELMAILEGSGDDRLIEKVSQELHPLLRSTGRFVDFLLKYQPGEPENKSEKCISIDWYPDNLKKLFQKVYDYRSRALHDGIPFPAPMCGPAVIGDWLQEAPGGLWVEAAGGKWMKKDLPLMLHTFEYIVRNSIINWWKSIIEDSEEVTDD